MKFRNYLETIAGVGIFPLISLIIFFVFFVALLFYVFKLDNKSINKMKNIPLNDGSIKKGILSIILFFTCSLSAFAQEPKEELRVLSGTDILLIMLLDYYFS